VSTLWTPGGEFPVGDRRSAPSASPPPPPPPPPASAPSPPFDPSDPSAPPLTDEEQRQLEAEMAELQQRLANTPAAVVVANHCFGLFELAALHLSVQPPNLAEAQVAIDALGAIVDKLTGRLGEAEEQLAGGLAQLRMAFVQIRAATSAPPPA
jgi:hypothetical protein